MKQFFLVELQQIKKQTEFILNNREIIENKDIEKYLRGLEKARYVLFNNIKLNNLEKNKVDEKINYINNSYRAKLENDILKIHIPEVLPKYKNISNYAYKNIMLSTAESVKEYKGLFKKNLTFVLIVVHENQSNMDIDNKYVKPIIDALVIQEIIQDDNITNMFYMVQGKNDTKKPYTDVFVMDAKYMKNWIENLEKSFKKV